MRLKNNEEYFSYISRLKRLGQGLQKVVYYDSKLDKCIKIYHDIFDLEFYECCNFKEEEILRFKDCKNDTYIFSSDIILLNDRIIGYIEDKVLGETIDKISPLYINLDNFICAVSRVNIDIEKISNYKIKTFDVLYNIMYGNGKISIIDFDEYNFTELEYDKLLQHNKNNFNMGIKLFLVDTYFDEFVASNKYLNELYEDKNIDINLFLKCFKECINEYMDYNITNLSEAKKLLNKTKHKENFIREYKI